MTRTATGVVALVGRVNVGKSALFNRLTRSQDALVVDRPGVTRDRQYGFANLGARHCAVVDTGGLAGDDATIDDQAAMQVDIALDEADAVVFVVDARVGLTADDQVIADRLRRSRLPVLVIANKAEGMEPTMAAAEFHVFGLGAPLAISATHGDRFGVLADQLDAVLPSAVPASTDDNDNQPIRLAVVGRPNVGKSSLVNHLVGSERMLTQDQAGTTRDAVETQFERDGQYFTLVDTAGMRRRSQNADVLERLGTIKAMQAINTAEVVLVLIDAADGLTQQDVRLLGLAVERGRAVVIAVNKWDRLGKRDRERLHQTVVERLASFSFLPLCFISATTGDGIDVMFDALRAGSNAARADLSTAALTRVLGEATTAHAPPLVNGRRIKLRYAHQGGRMPPTIVVHGNQTDAVPAAYTRYLARCFREAFDLFGTVVEISYRTSNNPYADSR
ncbi:ribosome biogenesis GTPase Der [Salinisphaera sp. USBA-960]|uniref:ribosome biogenesis GTPase Der n=1 Tax=Salinisphaera orenii TaxID=856731 RepID=UPI000DBE7321|nr:ribosome biogenesis GTPase Der [Salifodinibacter halophilus]NNC25778.1 ribosome biogenesis GTPase Der [Salifodinibacter halophilus]